MKSPIRMNLKLLSQVRAATRALLRKNPVSSTKVLRQALDNASALHQAALKMASPTIVSRDLSASNQPVFDADDLLGNLDLPREVIHTPVQPPLPGRFTDGSFTNEAGTRDYKLYVPGSYRGEPVPLLVMLHGCTQDPDDFAVGTRMNLLAEEMGFLVAYPAQSQQANQARCWNWFNAVDQQRGQGEPSIIAGITRAVMEQHAVQPGHVYVAGLSAGGAMAIIMGTMYPDLYAAVGVHSGLPYAAADDLSSALAAMKGEIRRREGQGAAVPIIVFHGDQDTTVHPANAEELIARGTLDVAKGIIVEPGQVPDGHAYTRNLHHREDGNVHAEHWVVHGGGHAWFGGSERGSYTDARGPDASREMLRFFSTRCQAQPPA